MFKSLLITCVAALMSCTSSYSMMYVSSADETLTTVGHNSHTEWECIQQETNQTAVFLGCKFHNFSTSTGEVNTCIKLSYLGKVNPDEVASSRVVCSDLLNEDTETFRFVAFQKQARQDLLIYCGRDNQGCKLISQEVQQ